MVAVWAAMPVACLEGQQPQPVEMLPRPDLSNNNVRVVAWGTTLGLELLPSATDAGQIRIPRLAATIREWAWRDSRSEEIEFVPEPTEWTFCWQGRVPPGQVIVVELESAPMTMVQLPTIQATADGSIWLPAHQAWTRGQNLRFEPQRFKNTIGYWTLAEDYAAWNICVAQPGEYSVAILQGCGDGQGGSAANIELRRGETVEAKLAFVVEETGHFQNFRWRTLSSIQLSTTGDYELRLSAGNMAGAALIDVRAIHLVRQATTLE